MNYGALWIEHRTHFTNCRSLLTEYRALLIDRAKHYTTRSTEIRAAVACVGFLKSQPASKCAIYVGRELTFQNFCRGYSALSKECIFFFCFRLFFLFWYNVLQWWSKSFVFLGLCDIKPYKEKARSENAKSCRTRGQKVWQGQAMWALCAQIELRGIELQTIGQV